MAKLFLSYSREDQSIASDLAKNLEEFGHAVWIDQDLSGGQAWWEQILARIRASDCFVFVLSAVSLDSIACQREFRYAADLHKPILPVLVRDGLSLNVLPPALSQVQFVDYRERTAEAIIALARSLQSLPVGMAMPDPLPAPPAVPLSYLGGLSQMIDTPTPLSLEEQSRLVLELKAGLRDASTHQDCRLLLGRLRGRRDLLATIADEIDEVFALAPNRQPMATRVRPWSGPVASPPRERSPALAGPTRPGQTEPAAPRPWPFGWVVSDPSTLDPSTLRRVAGQKIWVHWLLWVGPWLLWLRGPCLVFWLSSHMTFTYDDILSSITLIFSFLSVFTRAKSAMQTCNKNLFYLALIGGVAEHAPDSLPHFFYFDGYLMSLGASLLWGCLGGSLTHRRILQARKRLAAEA